MGIILETAWRGRWTVAIFTLGAMVAGAIGWTGSVRPPALALLGGPPLALIGGQVQAGAPWVWLLQYGLFMMVISHLVGGTGDWQWVALQRVRGISPGQWAMGQLMASGALACLWVIVMSVIAMTASLFHGIPMRGTGTVLPGLALAMFGLWAAAAPLVISQRLLGDERLGVLLVGLLVIIASNGSPLIYWSPFGYAIVSLRTVIPMGLSFLCLTAWITLWGLMSHWTVSGNVWP